jgi:hypothetical protein
MLSSILCLLLLATPANGAGVTKTRLGVMEAMGHALHLPASMTEWTTANQKSIKDIAAHQHRSLTSDDLFALESMQKYEEIMHSVFSEKNLLHECCRCSQKVVGGEVEEAAVSTCPLRNVRFNNVWPT